MIEIRRAKDADFDAIWEIFREVISTGDTFFYSPESTKDEGRAIWMSEAVAAYVALLDGRVVGSYILTPNKPGLGSHVANAGYIVSGDCRGKGIATAMCEHSIEEARRAGYLAMQFNAVVKTNERAVALWKRMGFTVIGTVPQGFRHQTLGLVDLLIMHRFLYQTSPD